MLRNTWYSLSVYFYVFAGMCTQMESEQTPKPTNTQNDSHGASEETGRQIHSDANRP